MEAGGAQGVQLFIFRPGEGDIGEGTAAGTVALFAATVVIYRMVEQFPVLFDFSMDVPQHFCAPQYLGTKECLFSRGSRAKIVETDGGVKGIGHAVS